jgi:hypothetical protein
VLWWLEGKWGWRSKSKQISWNIFTLFQKRLHRMSLRMRKTWR